jgi:hypothetical protein
MEHCCRPSGTNVPSLPLRAAQGQARRWPSRTTAPTTNASHSLTAQGPPNRYGGPLRRL